MTTYTLAGNATLRDVGNAAIFGVTTARTGGDIFNLNGKNLVIDEDSRYGKSGLSAGVTANRHIGNIVSSSTLGGNATIDGRYVRMIPFTSGSGTIVPGGVITCGSAIGVVIGVYSAINAAPVLTGVTTGWIKVTAWNGVSFPTSGSFTQAGYTFTISGPDITGFIEVVGVNSSSCTMPLLGTFSALGAWFDVGTATGDADTQYQLPTNGRVQHFAGVFVSKTNTPAQDSDYEFYACVGTLAGAGLVYTDETRGKVCWITTAGLLQFGKDTLAGGANLNGYIPPVGRKIVFPNVILSGCSTATEAENTTPSTTMATRYDFTTTSGGKIVMDKVACAWSPNFNAASSVSLSSMAVADFLALYNIGSEPQLSRVGVSVTPANQLYKKASFDILTNGINLNDCVFACVTGASTAQSNVQFVDCKKIRGSRNKTFFPAGWSASYLISGMQFVRSSGQLNDTILGTGHANFQYSSNVKLIDTTYFAKLGPNAYRGQTIFSFQYKADNALFDGLRFVDADCAPSSTVLYVSYYSSNNVELRNAGSFAEPLDFGGVATIMINAGGEPSSDIKLRRVWYSNMPQFNAFRAVAQNTGLQVDNVYRMGGTVDGVYSLGGLETRYRGLLVSDPPAATSGIALANGTHWQDFYLSETTGRVYLLMNEPSPRTQQYVTLGNNTDSADHSLDPFFTGSGSIALRAVGQYAIFEMDYFMLGHTGFSPSVSPTMGGGTFTNYSYAFQANTGSGYSAWSSEYTTADTLRDALAAMTIDYTVGVKLKMRITVTAANTSSVLTLFLGTTTTATAQQTLYPLGSASITFTGVIAGSEIRIYDNSTGLEIAGVESCSADHVLDFPMDGDTRDVRISILSLSYKNEDFDYTAAIGEQSIPVQPKPDKWYSNP